MVDLNANLKDERSLLKALEDLYKQKRFSDALSAAKKLKDAFPRSFHIRFLYVKILKELNRLAEAEESLKELMQLFPNNINVLLEMGKLSVERNKFDESIEYYNKILFLDPFNSDAKAAIDRINILKKNDVKGDKMDLDFASYSREKMYRADTLPEFDSKELEKMTRQEISLSAKILVKPPKEEKIEIEENREVLKEIVREDTQEEFPSESPIILDIEEAQPPEYPLFHIDLEDAEKEPDNAANESPGFVTESAAELYLNQGLFDDALAIYQKLYMAQRDERFLIKIAQMKKRRIDQKKIQALSDFMRVIERKYRGDQLV